MELASFNKEELDRLKSKYQPSPEFTKTLKQQDKLSKDTVINLLEQGLDPNDNGSYYEFPIFLQSEDKETFEVLRYFGANTDLSKLDPALINDAHLINFQFYDLYESLILALRPGSFAMVTELNKLKWLKSKDFDFNIPPFMKLQTFSLKTPWTVFVSPITYNLPEVTTFLLNETNLDFNLELVLEDSKIKGRFLNWHFYAFNILANEYRPVNDRKKDLEGLLGLLGNKIDIHGKTSEGRNVYLVLPFIKSAQAKEATKILMDLGIDPYEKDNSGHSFVDSFKSEKNMNAAVQLIETSKEKFADLQKKATTQVIGSPNENNSEKAKKQTTTQTSQNSKEQPAKGEEKNIDRLKEETSNSFSPLQYKLKKFKSILETYHRDNIMEVEAQSFIRKSAVNGLSSDDIDMIMVKLNQGSRCFGVMRVGKFLDAADRYLKTMDKEDSYADVVLEKHTRKPNYRLPHQVLSLMINDYGDRLDKRIQLNRLFSLDPELVNEIIDESRMHGKIVTFLTENTRSSRVTEFNEEQYIFDVGILFDDGLYKAWHYEDTQTIDQVKTVMNIDYIVREDGCIYHYDDSKSYRIVPGIDNIDEIWFETYFSLYHLKCVYRHKITKKLISVGYPQDDFLSDVFYPVRVCLFEKIRSVLDKDGTLKYKDRNGKETVLNHVYDAYYHDYYNCFISFTNGEILINDKSYRNINPAKVHQGGNQTILTDSKTNRIVYGLNIPLTEGVRNIEFIETIYSKCMKIELVNDRVLLIISDRLVYDSALDFGLADRIDFFNEALYGYTVRNELMSIGASENNRYFFSEYYRQTNQNSPQYINTVYDFKDYFACLTDRNQVFLKCSGKIENVISKVYDKFYIENVSALACTPDFIALLKLDGTLECFSQAGMYNGITKTKKYKAVSELLSFNEEIYFLTVEGECWKFSKQANTWILLNAEKIRSIRTNEEGLVANLLKVEKAETVVSPVIETPQSALPDHENIAVRSFRVASYTNTVTKSYFTIARHDDPVKQAAVIKSVHDVLSNNKWVHAGSSHLVWIDSLGHAFASGENLYGSCNVENWNNMIKIYAISNASIGLTGDNKIMVACTNRKISPWADVPSKEGVKDLAAQAETVIIIYQSGIAISFNPVEVKWKTISKSGIRVDVHSDRIYLIEKLVSAEDQVTAHSIEDKIVKKEAKRRADIRAIDETEQKRTTYLSNPDRHRVSVSKNHFALIMNSGKVLAAGDNTYGQCEVDTWKDIIAVAAGDKFTTGLTKNGDVLFSGIKYDFSLAWNIQGVSAYRNKVILNNAKDVAAVDAYFFTSGSVTYIGGTSNCYFIDDEGTLRNSHIYDNIVKKFKNIVDVISLPDYGGDCYLDANGNLFDNKNKVVDQAVLSVAKEKFLVKVNGLQFANGTVLYPDIPIAYDFGDFGLIYIDKEGFVNSYSLKDDEHIRLQLNVSETDKYGCISRYNTEEYKPYIAYVNEPTFSAARLKYQWQTSHQLAYFKKGYVGIDEDSKLVTNVDDLKAFIKNIEKPVKAVCSSSTAIAVLFMDGTVSSTTNEDLSRLSEITSLSISETNLICVDKYRNVSVFGNNDYSQHKAMEWKNIVDVAAGPDYVLGLTEAGEKCGEGNVPNGGFNSYSCGTDQISIFSFKNSCLTLGYDSYLSMYGTILKASDRMNLQTTANIISISAYENTIVLVNANGDFVSNQLERYEPVQLPVLPASVLLLKSKIIAKLIDGTIKEYGYDSIG
jgi:hypothetical protein